MVDPLPNPAGTNPEAAAQAAIDTANASDPVRAADGRADALRYADAVASWIQRLVPDADPTLRLAARAQHLERWAIPRDAYPIDKPGYFRWRKAVHARQGARVRELLAGLLDPAVVERVSILVAKGTPRDDHGGRDSQALEDAACLVFLEAEVAGFAARHADYDAERYVGILRKTLAKMSPAGRAAAAALTLDEPFAGLLRRALEPAVANAGSIDN